MELINRKEASRTGKSRYFTGKPCKRGHVAERFTRNHNCTQCDQEHREKDKELRRQQNLDYYERNRKRFQQYYVGHGDRYKKNEKRRRKENPGRINALSAKRKALKLKATPRWSEQEQIVLLYEEAHQKGMHVDHIVPLQGKTVCGLHVIGNLQLLTPFENLSKKNKFGR